MSKARPAPSSKDHASPAREAARPAPGAAAYKPPPYGIELADRPGVNRTGLPDSLKANVESLSGIDLSHVRVHRNSPAPDRVNALAYTQGHEIHLGPGQDAALAHELWHVVQQGQGRVRGGAVHVGRHTVNDDPGLESEADRMGARALGAVPLGLAASALARPHPGIGPSAPLQRLVRTDGGATKINENYYKAGGAGAAVGNKHKVKDLIADPVRRVFKDTAELEAYANGDAAIDYIGDVDTTDKGTFWYRLPANKLTVLGEIHSNPEGNVEDVILGLGTSRFMYEPYNAARSLNALNVPLTGTKARADQIDAGRRTAPAVAPAFDPSLEDIVIKALTGATVARTEFIAGDPANMSVGRRQKWQARATVNDYSFGERIALYLALAIHIAKDVTAHVFGPDNGGESAYIKSARKLKNFYLGYKATLDAFMQEKDADDLVGIYELTQSKGFANLRALRLFTLVFHEYASRYIEQLGTEKNNATLVSEGQALSANLNADLQTFSPAREEIIWERVLVALAGGYLLVGMGDAHRENLMGRLNTAGIRHEEVSHSLVKQKLAIELRWVP